MATRGGDGGWKLFGLLVLGGVALVYLKSGRGKDNSSLLPDALEDRIDHVVAALNRRFGHTWVNEGLNVLQAYVEGTMPGVASLVSAVFRAEQAYRHTHSANAAKKQAAIRYALIGG